MSLSGWYNRISMGNDTVELQIIATYTTYTTTATKQNFFQSMMSVWYDATHTLRGEQRENTSHTTRALDSNDHLMHSDISEIRKKFQTQLVQVDAVKPMVCARKVSFHSKSSLFSSANISSIQFPLPEFEISIDTIARVVFDNWDHAFCFFFLCWMSNRLVLYHTHTSLLDVENFVCTRSCPGGWKFAKALVQFAHTSVKLKQ